MRWPPWRKARDTTDEALEHLRAIEENAAKIARLSEELIETQRRNNFSHMVDVAIRRHRLREDGGA